MSEWAEWIRAAHFNIFFKDLQLFLPQSRQERPRAGLLASGQGAAAEPRSVVGLPPEVRPGRPGPDGYLWYSHRNIMGLQSRRTWNLVFIPKRASSVFLKIEPPPPLLPDCLTLVGVEGFSECPRASL